MTPIRARVRFLFDNLLKLDPADLVDFGERMAKESLGLALVISVNITIWLLARRCCARKRWRFWYAPSVVAVAIYLASARGNLMLALLGSEDDRIAERAYVEYSRSASLRQLISTSKDSRENPNVRFYVSRMLGERLGLMNNQRSAPIIQRISEASPFKPEFFNSNSVNQEFYGGQAQLTPDEVARYYWSATK